MTPDTRAVAELLSVEDIYQPMSDIVEDAFGEITEESFDKLALALENLRNHGIRILCQPGERIEEVKDPSGKPRRGYEYCIAEDYWDLLQHMLKEKNIEHNPSSPEEVEARKLAIRGD